MSESISNLPAATSVSSTDLVPLTQGSTGPGTGTTNKATVAQIQAAASAGPLNLSGNCSLLVNEIGQGTPYNQSYSLASVASTTTLASSREFMVSLNFTSNTGVAGPELGTDKVTLYSAAQGLTNTGDLWAFNPLLLMDATSNSTYIAQCIEVDLVNNQGNRGDSGFANGSYGVTIAGASTSTVYRNTAGLNISGNGSVSPTWNYGLIFTNNGINKVAVYDGSNSPYTLQVAGSTTHIVGVDLASGTYSSAPIRLPNAQNGIVATNAAGSSQYGLIEADGTNSCILGSASWATIKAQNTFQPSADNTYSLGVSGARWTAVWAVNGTIQTSDPTLKTNIAPLGSMLSFVTTVEPKSFKWIEGGMQMVPGKVKKTVVETREETRQKEVVQIVNGQAILTTESYVENVPVLDELPVLDQNGKPVMRRATLGIDSEGKKQTGFVPKTHHVPRMVEVEVDELVPQSVPGKRTHYGFMAPEIKAAMDSHGLDFGAYVKADDGTEALRPDQLIPVLWKAVQELAAEVALLKAK